MTLTELIGIYEADGNERLDILGFLVLQIFHIHAFISGTYDVLFPCESRRSGSGHSPRRLVRHIRVSATVCAVNHDIHLRHLNTVFERYAFRFVTLMN